MDQILWTLLNLVHHFIISCESI